MIKSQTWTWSHLQMVLGPLMTLVGRHLIMQRRVFWLAKQILSTCWMKVVLVLLLKWEDSHWKKFHRYLWNHKFFRHLSSFRKHCPEQLLNYTSQIMLSLLVPWTQSYRHYCYSCCNLFRSSFLPLWMIGSNTSKGGGELNRGVRGCKSGGIGWRGQVQGGGGDTFMIA